MLQLKKKYLLKMVRKIIYLYMVNLKSSRKLVYPIIRIVVVVNSKRKNKVTFLCEYTAF